MTRALAFLLLALPLAGRPQVEPLAPPPPPPAGPPLQSPVPPPASAVAPSPAAPAQPAPLPVPPPVAGPPPPQPQAVREAAPAPSRWRFGGSLGAGTSYGESYVLIGARLGYLLVGGLALDLEGQYWLGQDPQIGKIAPGFTWYSPFRLYAGAYYAHWMVGSGLPDSDAVGVRGGLTLSQTGRTFVGVGVAYEKALSCSTNCESWWPEASVGVSF